MIRIVCSALFIVASLTTYSQRVNSISFEGLTVTKESYLRDIISCKENARFDDKLFQDDIFLLRNLNLFFEVEGTAKTSDSLDCLLYTSDAADE